MSTDDEEVCSVCGGRKTSELKESVQRDEDGNIIYNTLQCTHCNGTGIEPK